MNGISKRLIAVILSAVSAASVFTPAVSAQDNTQRLLGDANLDGKISLKDASLVQRVSVNLETLSREQAILADVDGSDSVTLKDAFIIQRFSLSIKGLYPKNANDLAIGDVVALSEDTDETDTADTDSVISETDTAETDSVVSETDTAETDSVISETDTAETDSVLSETDTAETDTTVTETDTAVTDSEEPVIELPLEQINSDLNGDFERADVLPDGWIKFWDYMNASAAKGEGVNGSTALKIDNGTQDKTSFSVHRVKGLKPGADYKVTFKTRGESIVKNGNENGLTFDIGTCMNVAYIVGLTDDGAYEAGRGYMMSTTENWLDGTFDWKEVTMYFVADSKGMADVVFYLNGQGTAWFDDVVLETADFDSEVPDILRLVGKHTAVIIPKADVPDGTKESLQPWVDDLDAAYEQMKDLMGNEPYNGDICYIKSTQEPDITTANGCINPIKWNRAGMKEACVNMINTGYNTSTAYHEMGHNFDMMYPWPFNHENTADFKMAYIVLNKGENDKMYDSLRPYNWPEYKVYLKSEGWMNYDSTFAQRNEYTYISYYAGVTYINIRTCEAVGWDTVKATFRQFNEYYDTKYNKQYSKFLYWLMSMQNTYNKTHPEATGYEIIDSFPEGEYEYFKWILNECKYDFDESQDIHCVRFYDPDGNKLWFEFVPHGEAASPKEIPNHEKYGAFTGWDQDVSCVTSDMTVTANYENYKSAGSITSSAEGNKIYQGEFVEFTVNPSESGTYTYNIIVAKNGTLEFESGYSSSNMAKVFFAESGDYTVSAQVKDSAGNESSTSALYIKADRAATIYYSGFNNPNIHYKSDTGKWTAVPGKKMDPNSDVSGYSYKYVIPLNSEGGTAEICFNDGNNNWDNNGEKNYKVSEGAYGIKNGSVNKITG